MVDAAIAEDQVRIIITMSDGRRLDKFVEHAVGSTTRPMSDSALEKKFVGQSDGVLTGNQAAAVMDLCWQMESLPIAGALALAAAGTA